MLMYEWLKIVVLLVVFTLLSFFYLQLKIQFNTKSESFLFSAAISNKSSFLVKYFFLKIVIIFLNWANLYFTFLQRLCMWQVMKMMPKWHVALKGEFVKLLRDEVDIVLEGLVPDVSNILIGFAGSNTLTADKVVSKIYLNICLRVIQYFYTNPRCKLTV